MGLFLMMLPSGKSYLLPIIIFSQFAGTSLWFAGNAIIDQISSSTDQAGITSVVQFGFISGTLSFSFLSIADRYSAPKVFFLSSVLASLSNLLIVTAIQNDMYITLLRFITGFFLAGIYPVGMKITADIFPEKLGKALGFLVGALVLGTAFPHLIRSQLEAINWKAVLLTTSLLATLGGLLILLTVPAKPKVAGVSKVDYLAAMHVFQSKSFRLAAFGYFGHMWELYAFWSILPLLISYYNEQTDGSYNIYLWSFLTIAIGSLGCIAGGMLSQRFGSKTIAFYSLLLSCFCCLLAPLLLEETATLFFSLLLFWGLTVTADSPQFSALVAKHAEPKHKGTALSIVTAIGFSITIASIILLNSVFQNLKEYSLWLLAIGPFFGLIVLRKP